MASCGEQEKEQDQERCSAHPLLPACQQQAHLGQIRWQSDFRIRLCARNQPHRLSDQLTRGGIVGEVQAAPPHLRQRAPDHVHLKRLGCLHRPQLRAIEVARDGLAVARFLDRVGDRLRRDGGAGFTRRFDGGRD